MTAPIDPLLGIRNFSLDQFGRRDQIGRGHFGDVWKYPLMLNVAVKIPKERQDPQKFQREAQVHFGLKHPNIIEMFGVVKIDSKLRIVMEFVNGTTLRDATQVLSIPKVVDISYQIANGLSYLHNEAKIVHGDIKSNNILLVMETWQVKILDFGCSARISGSQSSPLGHITSHIHAVYAAHQFPGIYIGVPATPDLDMLCYGLLLTEMMEPLMHTQQTRPEIKSAREILLKIITECKPMGVGGIRVLYSSEVLSILSSTLQMICLSQN